MLKMLEMMMCEPCDNDREAWARVWTIRDGITHVSELSWRLARRLLPKLAARHGVTDLCVLFAGRPMVVRR